MVNMTIAWQLGPKYGQHGHSEEIMLKNVANIPKMWQTCPQCGNQDQNVANMPTVWQLGPQCTMEICAAKIGPT